MATVADSRENLDKKNARQRLDLEREKKSYLQRKQEEKESKRALHDFRRHLRQEGDLDE